MYKIIFVFLLFIFVVLAKGCELFNTRDPEPPDSGRTIFLPPTSPQIVLDNFINSIKDKNTENYIACLADSSDMSTPALNFLPAADANSRYPGLFANWNIQSERRWVVSFFSSILKENIPEIDLRNKSIEINSPDSAVYTSDYFLTANHTNSALTKSFSGKMILTLKQRSSGLWYIVRWLDSSPSQSDSTASWSMLKAFFYN